MAARRKTPTAGPQTLKIGSRVRCTDDGVEGRIVWANGVSVKIKWNDGEQVTWRRDSLAGRPIEILADDEDRSTEPAAAPAEPAAAEAPPPAPPAIPEPASAENPAEAAAEAPPAAAESAPEPPAGETPGVEPTAAQTPPEAADPAPAEEPPAAAPDARGSGGEPTPAAARPKRERKAPAEAKEKKLSAIDAAARVLAETGQPMTCPEMIGAMAAKGYWTSPGGKTPGATLCSALLREIKVKGEQSRFVKAAPGRFARRGA